jgi:hypothetical protein
MAPTVPKKGKTGLRAAGRSAGSLAKPAAPKASLRRRTEASLKKATGAAETFAKKHPAVVTGLLLGAGGLVGAAAGRALRRDPTVGEVMVKALKRGATTAGQQVASAAAGGLRASKSGLRRALR